MSNNKFYNKYFDLFQKQQNGLTKYFSYLTESDELRLKTAEFVKLLKTSNTVYFSGIGKNYTIATKTANMFRSIRCSAHVLDAIDAMHGDMGMLKSNDLVIGLSRSGTTSELINTFNYISENFDESPNLCIIHQNEDIEQLKLDNVSYIQLPRISELDEWNLVPSMSNISMQLYLDMVAMLYKEYSELTKQKFVNSHPGGFIGHQK